MYKIIAILVIFLGCSYAQEYIYKHEQALDNFVMIAKEINKAGSVRGSIEQIEQLNSGEITDSSDYSFEDYLAKTNHINNLNFNRFAESEKLIFREFVFRTIAAAQHNLEKIFWEMPDQQKYVNLVLFATTMRELSQIKSKMLNEQLNPLSTADNELKQRGWQALRRMLIEIDIPMSESGNQFVQRSPYGLIIRKGELSNKLKSLADNEPDKNIKTLAEKTVQDIFTNGKKYKDIGRPIVIGAGPEITDLINKEALLYFNTAMEAKNNLQKIAYYTKAIETDSNFASAFYNRGVSNFEEENYQAAINDFNYSLILDTNQTDVYSRLGDSYMKTEQYKTAIENYTKALEHQPSEPALLISRGISYEKKHEYESAIKDYTAAIGLDSTSVSAYNNRAQSYLAVKDYNNAINDYNTLIRLRPDNSTYYFNLGCIYWEHRNWQKVNEVWNKGLAVNPNDKNILQNLPEIKKKSLNQDSKD